MTTCKENAQGYAEFISRGTPWGDGNIGIRGEGEACSFIANDINNLERSCIDSLKDEPDDMECSEFLDWVKMITDSGALKSCATQDKPNPVVLQFDIDVDDEDLDKMTRMTARDILSGEYERPDCRVVDDVLQCDGRIDEFSGSRYRGVVLPDKIDVVDLGSDYLYHWAPASKVDSILKRGLIPRFDPHMEASDLPAVVVNLCEKDKCDRWKGMIEGSVFGTSDMTLLKVKVDKNKLRLINRDYGWFVSDEKISPENIGVVNK